MSRHVPADGLSSPKWRSILLVAVVEALALSVWFAGSVIMPQLTDEWSLSSKAQSWMTMSVQLGSVAGPVLRLWSMARLRRLPEARRMASGRR